MTPPCGVPASIFSIYSIPYPSIVSLWARPAGAMNASPSFSTSVGDAFPRQRYEFIVRDTVEVTFDFHIHQMNESASQQLIHAPQGGCATTAGPESVALGRKLPLEDGFDHHPHRLLHHAVCNPRYSQRPLFGTSRLRDHDPYDRLGLIGASCDVLLHGEQPIVAVFVEVPYRHAVRAADPGVGLHFFRCQSECPVCLYLVDQTEPRF